jgi:DNA (cytosine-5)-methyltransferase 1
LSHLEVIDLFAGPGGLGEGFASYSNHERFKILYSVEMDSYACQTLRGRKALLLANENGDQKFHDRYLQRLFNGRHQPIGEELDGTLWNSAKNMVIAAEMGTSEGNAKVDNVLNKLKPNDRRVLIGGPPCQAYSLVGRARNAGNAKYDPKTDKRNYLYTEYLRVLNKVKPAVFVMENVKGINSAKIDGQPIISQILEDLADPGKVIAGKTSATYRLYSLTTDLIDLTGETDPNHLDPKDFVIRCEDYGIPQARHRVIIFGVRSDIAKKPELLVKVPVQRTVRNTIRHLPPLRSGFTDIDLRDNDFATTLAKAIHSLSREASKTHKHKYLAEAYRNQLDKLDFSSLKFVQDSVCFREHGVANHFSRKHMLSDLVRYFHAAVWSGLKNESPKGEDGFPLPSLTPDHKNWSTGKFNDRFRCQSWDRPSTTIVSHISKDGHYFIHPDPAQCRSLSVREAALLQTFPEDYIFEGPQTAQFHQVGNAVPVDLARQIAGIVSEILN